MQDFSLLGEEVAVSEVDKGLRRLWEADEARTNASLMNLVLYSESPDGLLKNNTLARELTRENACRVILIAMDRKLEKASLKAWITAHCNLAYGRKTVCCEQIAFSLTGRAVGRLRNTLFAHLHSDLPVVFWWQGDLSSLFTEDLYRSIDRFLFDSAEWKEPVQSLIKLEEAIEQTKGKIILQDLAWTRTYHIRLAIAAIFDDTVAQEALANIKEVEIRGGEKYYTSAMLVFSWLATQAKWSLSENGQTFLTQEGLSINYNYKIHGKPPITMLRFRAKEAIIELTWDEEAQQIHTEIKSESHHLSASTPADPLQSEQLVAQQLSRGGKNSLYRKVLPAFKKLLECGI